MNAGRSAADGSLTNVYNGVVEFVRNRGVALVVAAFDSGEALVVLLRQSHEEVGELLLPFFAESVANDERTVRDQRRTPDFDQLVRVDGALVDFLAEGTGGVAVLEIADARGVVDGNVDRVLARYLALDVPVRDAKDLIRATVQAAVPPRAGDFAQALMDLGATICAPRAVSCLVCPLQPGCAGTVISL